MFSNNTFAEVPFTSLDYVIVNEWHIINNPQSVIWVNVNNLQATPWVNVNNFQTSNWGYINNTQ